MSIAKSGRVAYVNAHVIDPASGLDGPAEVLTSGEEIDLLLDLGLQRAASYGDGSRVEGCQSLLTERAGIHTHDGRNGLRRLWR